MFLKYSRLLLALHVLVLCFAALSFEATLPAHEVEALRNIGKALGKEWDFSVDPCSGKNGWITQENSGNENAVTCNCSFSNNAECHVVSIVLKSQNLQGTLPPDVSGLPYLQELDLARNYLNGTIPPKWGSTNLVTISFYGNRLTGPIPEEFGNITTLKSLVVPYNRLSGSLPPELGNLHQLERLHLSSNYFNGTLPETFGKLTTLKEFLISDNQFTGRIPDFIQNWTSLELLVIQASGLQGPIPFTIASIENITDLRISDLNGTEAQFPPLHNMKKIRILILRSCNIVGPIPSYIGDMAILKTLDLSFNKLNGKIPQSFSKLKSLENLFLTGNSLTGPVPDWMWQKRAYSDLSYNNFTTGGSNCEQNQVNLFASSATDYHFGMVTCLRNFVCPKTYYSMHINCGGKQTTLDEGTVYEEDTTITQPSTFHQSSTNWAFSSTGVFMDFNFPNGGYIGTLEGKFKFPMNNTQLYKDARLSPLSLTYYGFCLGSGSYNISLHFAEIMFKDDKSYHSLGRRYFDVYIQGERVLKDFNIVDEAHGVGKPVIKTFTVNISSSLEIRFYWAGKGTTDIPHKGIYGPLISAISVNPNFHPPREEKKTLSVGAISGIVVSAVTLFFLVLSVLWLKWRRKETGNEDLRGLHLQIGSFTLKQIRAATDNFHDNNKIGEGGFGPVYKGILADGTFIAVKQLSSKSRQGTREFINEIGMISALQHPHLVKLFGCCVEGSQLLLIYEYMENNSLANVLFDKGHRLHLDWPTRYRICIGIARGLAYLHEESRVKIVHRDIKATNVLLDANLIPKISDFGLAKLDEEDNTHISTRIAGTYGYMSPEYAMHGYLTDKADVYSFGIVVLEIVSGRSNSNFRPKEECLYLLDWARCLKDKDNIIEMVDPKLGLDFNKEQVTVVTNIALLCTSTSPARRPAMSSVVNMLEGKLAVEEVELDSIVASDEMKASGKKHSVLGNSSSNSSQFQTMSSSGMSSSSRASDKDPIKLDYDIVTV